MTKRKKKREMQYKRISKIHHDVILRRLTKFFWFPPTVRFNIYIAKYSIKICHRRVYDT